MSEKISNANILSRIENDKIYSSRNLENIIEYVIERLTIQLESI